MITGIIPFERLRSVESCTLKLFFIYFYMTFSCRNIVVLIRVNLILKALLKLR